jgi:hypothetical protein
MLVAITARSARPEPRVPYNQRVRSLVEVLSCAGCRGKGHCMGAELFRGAVGKGRLGPNLIAIVPPFGKQCASLRERREGRLIEALVAEAAGVVV